MENLAVPGPIDIYAGEDLELRHAWIALAEQETMESFRRVLVKAKPDDVVILDAKRELPEPPYGRVFSHRKIGTVTVAQLLEAMDLALDKKVLLPAWSLAGYLRDNLSEHDMHPEPW